VLDYGASWGYGTWQFSAAGFSPVAYEVSRTCAAFGQKLGLKIVTNLVDVPGPFDAVYSGHVWEHVPNPIDALHEQLRRTKSDGYVVAPYSEWKPQPPTPRFSVLPQELGPSPPFFVNGHFYLPKFSQPAGILIDNRRRR
jgi:hypothetical protein